MPYHLDSAAAAIRGGWIQDERYIFVGPDF